MQKALTGTPNGYPRHKPPREAYEAYIKARASMVELTGKSLRQALALYQRAIEIDSQYAAAYAGMAETYDAMGTVGVMPPGDAVRLTRAYAQKAVALEDSGAEAHAILGELAMMDWNWDAAQKEYERALALDSNLARAHRRYGDIFLIHGRFQEDEAEAAKTIELDPLNMLWKLEQAFDSYYEGDFPTAEQRFKDLLRVDENYAGAHSGLSRVYAVTGRFTQAIPEVRQAVAMRTGDAKAAEELAHALRSAYATHGERGYWEILLQHEQRNSKSEPYYNMAFLYAHLGNRTAAIAQLAAGVRSHAERMETAGIDPAFAAFRSDPAMQKLLHEMNLH